MPENELELRSMLAEAKLSVAEKLGWSCALLSLPWLYDLIDSWWLSLLAATGIYILATFQYKRDASVAEEAYHRHVGLGRFFVETSAVDNQ